MQQLISSHIIKKTKQEIITQKKSPTNYFLLTKGPPSKQQMSDPKKLHLITEEGI